MRRAIGLMMITNAPIVLFGDVLAKRMPLKAVRIFAALTFAVLAVIAFASGEIPLPP